MGKFSTGLAAGTVIGIGVMLMDKRTAKRLRKIARRLPDCFSWI